jgi:hypothetical protein
MSKRHPKARGKRLAAVDSRSVEMLTVGWMLMVVTTLVCEVGSGIAHWYVAKINPRAQMIDVLSGLLLFAAFVIGFLLLLLSPVIIKGRRTPPPRGVIVFAVVVGIAPLLVVLFQAIR